MELGHVDRPAHCLGRSRRMPIVQRPPPVADRQPAPKLCPGRVLSGGYVDNFLILAASYCEAQERFAAVCGALAKLCIALHELREPTSDSDSDYLGLEFTFDHKLRSL